MKSSRHAVRFWAIASIVAVAIALLIPLTYPLTAAQKPMFTNLVTGAAINSQLDPQAKAILDAAAKSGGLPLRSTRNAKHSMLYLPILAAHQKPFTRLKTHQFPVPVVQFRFAAIVPKRANFPSLSTRMVVVLRKEVSTVMIAPCDY